MALNLIRHLVLVSAGALIFLGIGHTPAIAQPPIRSTLDHPRIYFDAPQVATLQQQAATTHQTISTPILTYATNQIGTAPPAAPPPGSNLAYFGNQGNQLITLAFACVISGDAALCDLARDYLLGYAAWPQWGENDTRSLGHALMLYGNAVAYDWLHPILTLAERDTVRLNLGNRADEIYEASLETTYRADWDNWWGSSYIQNHYSTIHSALGMAGLVLLNEDVRATDWVARAADRLSIWRSFVQGMDDGTWHESLHYQNYVLSYALPFLTNLQDLQGINLFPDAYLQNYVMWRIYNHLPNSNNALLSYGNMDPTWANTFWPPNSLRLVASRYNNGHAEWMAQQIISFEGRTVDVFTTPFFVFEFLHYNPSVAPRSPNTLSSERIFSDSESVIWRTGWDANDLIFGFKSGAFGGRFAFDTFVQQTTPWEIPCATSGCSFNAGHNHNDANTFYIYRANQWLAPETTGVGNTATSFHNTLLIDGQGQYRPPNINTAAEPSNFVNRDASLLLVESTRNYGYLASDAARRYDIAGLSENTRHVVFVNSEYFVMLDNLVANAPHQYEWVAHFGQSVSVAGNWIRGDSGGGQVLGVAVASPTPFQFTTGNDGRPFVRTRPAAPVSNARLIHVLFPTTAADWNNRPDVATLADTGQEALIEVRRRDGSDCVDNIFMRYAGSGITSAATFTSDARVSVATLCPNNNLTSLFVTGGTTATLQGTLLVSGLQAGQSFDAQFANTVVTVSGSITSQLRLLAPQAQQLFVNGSPTDFTRDGDYIIFGAGDNVQISAPRFIAKTANPPFALAGDLVDWVVELFNPSSATMTDIHVQDILPGELQILQVNASGGTATVNQQVVELTLAQLDPGQRIVINISTRVRPNVSAPFIIRNQARLLHSGQSDAWFADASVLSVRQLPLTGQAARTPGGWPSLPMITGGVFALGLCLLGFLRLRVLR